MNKTSNYNVILFTLICTFISFIFSIACFVNRYVNGVIYSIVWTLGFLSMVIMNFQLYDIFFHFDSSEVELVSILKRKTIGISGLKIYNARLAKGYIYLIETSNGNWWIYKNKSNYEIIMRILKYCNYKDIKFIEKKLQK